VCVISNRDMVLKHEMDHGSTEPFQQQLGTVGEHYEMSAGIDRFFANAFDFLKWMSVCS